MSIKVKRGLAINLPTLEEGELGFTTDSYEMYVGSDNGNILLNNGEILIRRNNGMLQYAQSSRKNQWFDICSLEEIRGDQGIQGIQGIQGVKGDKGDKGERGIQGEKGNPFTYADFTPDQLRALKGEKGDTGAKGERGLTGDKGDRGVGLNYAWSGTRLGVKRDTDAQYTYVDLRGADGKDGKQGERGERGIQGEKGDTPSIAHLETQIANKSKELDTKFNTLTAKQQQDAEVVTARDGEVSLHARLERDLEKGKIHFVDVEGSNVSTESEEGYLENVEIHGNTWQDANNLSDIRSVGTKVEGQELYEIDVVSCGKNLLNPSNLELIVENVNNAESFEIVDKDTIVFNCPKSYNQVRLSIKMDTTTLNNIKSSGIVYAFVDNSWVEIPMSICGIYDGYIAISFVYNWKPITKLKIVNFQLEEGTQATPYEPYQEDKLTILSPTPLEKVGDVADRIICKDGVWGVEKNVTTEIFDDSYVYLRIVLNAVSPTEYISYCTPINGLPSINSRVMSDKFLPSTGESVNVSELGNLVSIHSNGKVYFRLKISELTTDTEVGFKEWIRNNNNITVKYQATQPTFIPLPQDQQIKLRTFADRTHIHFDTEIQPTLKAQVPKSLGATVNTHTTQIDNLNKELDRVKKLEESTVSTVTSDKAFTTVSETSNGYFEDVKIEGKTLVNLVKGGGVEKSIGISGGTLSKYDYFTSLKNNTLYTVILNIDAPNEDLTTLIVSLNGGWKGHINKCINGINCITLTTDETDHNNFWVYFATGSEIVGTPKLSNVVILEGDHTDKDLSYFEGLKSVGQDTNEISVSSIDSNGNLFDENVEFKVGHVNTSGSISSAYKHTAYTDYILLEKGDYCINTLDGFRPIIITIYNSQKAFKTQVNTTTFTLTETSYIRLSFRTLNDTEVSIASIKNVMLNKGTTPKPYQPHKSDKKQILYFNPNTQTWGKPVLREWDSIEKHSNGKYYYHKRSEETSFTDSSISVYREDDVYISFSCTGLYGLTVHSPNIICNMINTIKSPLVANEECMYCLSNNYIYIKILKSRLSAQNAEGFRQWLQANNVTVVYQLAQEEVYECTNLDLITYNGETNLIVNSGVIQPKITLKVLSNISNVVKLLQEKVSVLENKFIKGLQQVLAGDMMSLAHLLYPEDFTLENDTPQVIPYIEEGDINE